MRKKIILTATTDLNFDQRMQRIAVTLSNEYEVILVGRLKKKSMPFPENLPYRSVRLQTVFESGKGFYTLYNIRLFLFLLFNKADIITATDLDTLPACYFAAKLKSVKLGFDAHEWFSELPELSNRPAIRNIWLKIERWFVPGTDFAYTVNQSIANMYKAKFGREFSVVRNMPFRQGDEQFEKDPESQSPKIILYQGVLNMGRGLESMIEAMDQLDGFELHLAGEGDLSALLMAQASMCRYPQRIVFHGYVLPKKLKLLTKRAFIGINLLENTSLNYYYSLANKFFDYVQAAVPQITMNYPEYKLLNQENQVAILVENISVQEILKAVSTLSDPSAYMFLKENCRTSAEKWCWENESEVLLQIYRNQHIRKGLKKK